MMTKNKNTGDETTKLRKKAEEKLRGRPGEAEDLSPEAKDRLLHELRVHQTELEMQNDELRRAQLELEAARDEYSNLYDFAPVGYLTVNQKGFIDRANLTIASMLGVYRNVLIGKLFGNFVLRDDQDTFYKHRQRLLETETPQSCDLRLVKKDGQEFYARLECMVITNKADNLKQIRVAVSDISDRTRAEEALRERTHNLGERVKELNCLYGFSKLVEKPDISLDEIFQGLVDLIPPSWQYPEITCSRMLLEDKEYKTENFKETSWKLSRDILVYGKRMGVLEICYLEEKPEIDEVPFLKEERNLIDAITEKSGHIIERKQAEEDLLSERERLASILEGTNVGTWEWNVQTGETIFNERWAEIIGYSLEEISPVSIDTWMKFTHPDDLKNSGELLQRHFSGELDYYECEARMRHKNGEWVWVLDRGKVAVWTEDGNPLHMMGTHQDINERKQAEEQIKQNLKEKEVLLSEVHHRVKNNMQVITSLLRLQSSRIEDKRYAAMFKDTEERIKSMALIHEKLYRTKDFAKIDFNDYAKSLANHLIRTYSTAAGKIKLNINIEDIPIGIDKAIPCGLIINELLSNALKYAFPKGEGGEIKIVLRQTDSHEIELTVSDDGIGIPAEMDVRKTESLGLQLVHILAENQLDGEIELDRDGGTAFRIRIGGETAISH